MTVWSLPSWTRPISARPIQHRMTRLVLTLRDPDHLVQEWTSRSGVEEHTGRFEFTRRR